MKTTKLKLTNRGWNVIAVLGTASVIVLAGWMEAAL